MFIRIALEKINELIKRNDFKSIEYIDDKNITILFADKCCNVSSFGNVTWVNEQKEQQDNIFIELSKDINDCIDKYKLIGE